MASKSSPPIHPSIFSESRGGNLIAQPALATLSPNTAHLLLSRWTAEALCRVPRNSFSTRSQYTNEIMTLPPAKCSDGSLRLDKTHTPLSPSSLPVSPTLQPRLPPLSWLSLAGPGGCHPCLELLQILHRCLPSSRVKHECPSCTQEDLRWPHCARPGDREVRPPPEGWRELEQRP